MSGFHFPKATRPLEYVAFFSFEMPTGEGPAFVFMAVDAYSGFAFHLGVARDDSPEQILKCIYLLTEHENFVMEMHKGFTLVFEKYQELETGITAIISPLKGKVIFDQPFCNYLAIPVMRGLSEFLSKK